MRYGVAIDLGTSGYRAQKINLYSKDILRTAITLKNPIPGMNVMNHVDFAIHYGQDLAHGLSINAVKNLFGLLIWKLGKLREFLSAKILFIYLFFRELALKTLLMQGNVRKRNTI